MLTGKLLLPFLALFVTVNGDCEIQQKTHKTGETATEGRIIFECLDNGRKPVACITHNHRMTPGTKWNSDHKPDGGFVYECVNTGNLTMALNIIACIAPDGKEFQIGEKVSVEGSERTCTKKSDNEVTQSFNKGCENNGKLVNVNDLIEAGFMKKICVYRSNNYTMEAYSCVLPDNQEVRVGTYAIINKDFYKCTADLIDLSKAVQEKINVTTCGPHSGSDRHLLDEWKEGNATYRCLYNMTTSKVFTSITKCHYDDNVDLNSGETAKSKDGHYYYCNPVSGLYIITDQVKYCNLPDGSKLEVTQEKDVANVRYKCLFTGEKSAFTVEGCVYTGGEVIAYGNHTKLAHGAAYKCTQLNGKFQMVKMTAQEYNLAFDLEQGSISGKGGKGEGNTDATEEPSTVLEEASTPKLEQAGSTQNEEHPSTPTEQNSTQKEETSTQKVEPSTHNDESSIPVNEASTPANEPSTHNDELSTHKDEPSTQKEEPSTPEPHTDKQLTTEPTDEPSTEAHEPTKLQKPTVDLNLDKTTVRTNIDETVPPHCPDLHHMCEKFGHICNPEKFKDHHKSHSHFRRGSHSRHSSHDSDESCDWSDEVDSKEEHCTDCNKKLKHMKKAHVKLIKMMCPQTCGCGCFGGD